MSLEPGARLGLFEILGPLGAGGMGEVYRARDTRLGRDVALKVLPPAFLADPQRVARFEREARMLAAINHPAIAAIYGAEEAGDVPYIVMELVPGDTLAERLTRGRLSLEESLPFARQIAEALEAAHAQGVVHRDLKPSNIKITPDGKVKVLDLGLAKAIEAPQERVDLSRSPTVVLQDETRPGVILGTVEFMSPEQARGKEVDGRTDIWAFGCVLFEMLSGRRAFSGDTVSDILVAILTQPPAWSALPAYTPPRLRELLARCLDRDPENRLRDIRHARVELEQIVAGTQDVRATVERRPPAAARRSLRFLLGASALLLAAAAWFGLRAVRSRPKASSASRSLVVLPFRDLSGSPQGQMLGDGLVETISARLNRVPGIQILTPVDEDRKRDPYGFAKSVGALILRGSIQREGDRIRITYSLLKAPDGVQLAGDDVTGEASKLFALQDELTEKVASTLSVGAGPIRKTPPSGLDGANQQERYVEALGYLQRYDKSASVDESVRLLEALAAERPGSGLVQATLGRAYLHKFNLTRERIWAQKASQTIRRAESLAPEQLEVEVTLGELSLRTGKPAEAVAAFRRALLIKPNDFDALLGLARAYDSAGDPGKAETIFRRAIALQPSYWVGYSKLGGFFFARGQYSSAAEMFRRVTEISPDNARGFSNLGAAYHQLGRFQEALDAFRKSISLEPTARAYTNAGTTEFFLARYGEASEDFQKAVVMTPQLFGAWVNLADAYHWARDARAAETYERAIRLLKGELDLNPRDGSAWASLAVCSARKGLFAEAHVEIQKAVELKPEDPAVLYDAAIVASVTGRREEVLAWLLRAVKAGYGLEVIRREPEFSSYQKEDLFQKTLESAATRRS